MSIELVCSNRWKASVVEFCGRLEVLTKFKGDTVVSINRDKFIEFPAGIQEEAKYVMGTVRLSNDLKKSGHFSNLLNMHVDALKSPDSNLIASSEFFYMGVCVYSCLQITKTDMRFDSVKIDIAEMSVTVAGSSKNCNLGTVLNFFEQARVGLISSIDVVTIFSHFGNRVEGGLS